jgi:deazaflavin-dependent oxidoreductase (nitroreductase family)
MIAVARTRLSGASRFVTRFVNPVTVRIAGWAPRFGIVTYTGRKSGRTYRAPVNVFSRGNDRLFVLTYGSDAQWVKNILASGECELRSHRRSLRLTEPIVLIDPTLKETPRFVRVVGRLIGATQCLRMRVI